MSVNVVCGKCGERIHSMKMLKSIRDAMVSTGGKCPACGEKLSASEFNFDVKEK